MPRSGEPHAQTIVVAGSYQQFRNWCHLRHINPRSRRLFCVLGYHDLLRCRGLDREKTRVAFTGTYYETREWGDMADEVKLYQVYFDIPSTEPASPDAPKPAAPKEER